MEMDNSHLGTTYNNCYAGNMKIRYISKLHIFQKYNFKS